VQVLPRVRFASGTNAGIGVWLILAPFILAYSGVTPALWNDIVVGAWLLVVAGMRAINTTRYEGLSWTNLGFGLWLIVAPFILSYGDFAMGLGATALGEPGLVETVQPMNVTGAIWNDVVVGLIVAVLAGMSAAATRSYKKDIHRADVRI